MAAPVLPVAKALYLCDEILEDPVSRKVSLLGALNAVRPQGVPPFPHRQQQLCVVVQLTGGSGEVRAHVEVIQAATGLTIHTTQEHRIRFASRNAIVYANFRLRDVVFPESGAYFVEFYCQETFLDDRVLYLLEGQSEP